jgi:uncharacterized protein (DUF362 family)
MGAGAGAAGLWLGGCATEAAGVGTADATEKRSAAGLTSYVSEGDRAAAVRRAVELAGGMSWLKPGDRVLIKPAHNSPHAYPFTASPVACAELVRMCLEAGAKQVVVADCMGIEHTLGMSGWALENPWGKHNWLNPWRADKDATLRAMKKSGLYDAVRATVKASDFGKNKRVHVTSFRELGWRRYESEKDTPGKARLVADWVKSALKNGETWEGGGVWWPYLPRKFDFGDDVPGMYLPKLFDQADHVINLFRVSTHVWSFFTMALKNWIGVMRPDDRMWLHQLNYIKNERGQGADPIRTEMIYHELLAELHMATYKRERLLVADASEVIASGGPDETDKPFYPSRTILAATDLVSADVVSLAVLRNAVLASQAEGGLGGVCEPVPQNIGQLVLEFIGGALPWREEGGPMHGTDQKLCDPSFSHWDWVAIQRARELGMGASSPDKLDLHFDDDGPFALPPERRAFIEDDALRPPTRS